MNTETIYIYTPPIWFFKFFSLLAEKNNELGNEEGVTLLFSESTDRMWQRRILLHASLLLPRM